jgi:hypothetical protein
MAKVIRMSTHLAVEGCTPAVIRRQIERRVSFAQDVSDRHLQSPKVFLEEMRAQHAPSVK